MFSPNRFCCPCIVFFKDHNHTRLICKDLQKIDSCFFFILESVPWVVQQETMTIVVELWRWISGPMELYGTIASVTFHNALLIKVPWFFKHTQFSYVLMIIKVNWLDPSSSRSHHHVPRCLPTLQHMKSKWVEIFRGKAWCGRSGEHSLPLSYQTPPKKPWFSRGFTQDWDYLRDRPSS